MKGEQFDRALAYAIEIRKLIKEEGRDNRILVPMDNFTEQLGIKYPPLPVATRQVFYQYNIYFRKLRGQDTMAIWWQKKKIHGRGVKKNADM